MAQPASGVDQRSGAVPQVFVGGLPCLVTAATARNVTCTVPRQYGLIRAEYWALPWGRAQALPDFSQLGQAGASAAAAADNAIDAAAAAAFAPTTNACAGCCQAQGGSRAGRPLPLPCLCLAPALPLPRPCPLPTRPPTHPPPCSRPAAVTTSATGLTLAWGDAGPEGLGQADFWAARLTFWLEVLTDTDYVFQLAADDDAKLVVDGKLVTVANQKVAAGVRLAAGYRKFELLYVDLTGTASLSLLWSEGSKVGGGVVGGAECAQEQASWAAWLPAGPASALTRPVRRCCGPGRPSWHPPAHPPAHPSVCVLTCRAGRPFLCSAWWPLSPACPCLSLSRWRAWRR
jgi:hypothetical protein